MDFNDLESFSALVARHFAEVYPKWINFMRHNPNLPELLIIEIPSPTGESQIYIWTNEHGELFLDFDLSRSIHGYAEQTDQEIIDEVQEVVEDILQEKLLAAVRMKKGKWQTSALVTVEQGEKLTAADFTYIKSWKGTYSCVLSSS